MILDRLVADASAARLRGHDIISPREGYARLLAARDELWGDIKANNDILASAAADWLVVAALRFLSELYAISIDTVARGIREEIERDRGRFAVFNSAHEGYAVLVERFDELWEEIKADNNGDRAKMIAEEATRIGAIGLRLLVDIWGAEIEGKEGG